MNSHDAETADGLRVRPDCDASGDDAPELGCDDDDEPEPPPLRGGGVGYVLLYVYEFLPRVFSFLD